MKINSKIFFLLHLFIISNIWTSQREDAFTKIYLHNGWQCSESKSGTGSTLEHTKIIRNIIPKIIQEYNIQIFLDCACGDFNWMKLVNFGSCKYIGVDIVSDAIKINNEKYSNQNRFFFHKDITQDELPQSDLILCRDALGHLAYTDIFKALKNFQKSGAHYVLLTTFNKQNANRNRSIKSGEFFCMNLQAPPFNFPPPLAVFNEQCPARDYNDKSLGLWDISQMNFD